MVSLYGRLFMFRERPGRSPLEDFLTEALADLLNRMPPFEMTEFVCRFFLPPVAATQQAWLELVRSCSGEPLQWITRPGIHFRTLTLYPDLMLCAGENRPLLIVENKIGGRIGEHDVGQIIEDNAEIKTNNTLGFQTAEPIDQLASYGQWLSVQCEQHPWPGAVSYPFYYASRRIWRG
jgi:hypothetical protein